MHAEKDRRGLLGKIKDFVYDKAGWKIPSPAPDGKKLLFSITVSLLFTLNIGFIGVLRVIGVSGVRREPLV